MENAIVTYLADRQCSSQWKGFLQNLAEVLASVGSETELKSLAHRAGMRFASQQPLPACDTLDDIRLAMCAVWHPLDWGWVELYEHPTHLQIVHRCSPLVAGFGSTHALWVSGYLEGAYQQWFDALGSDTSLRVQQAGPIDAFGTVDMKLAQ